MINPLHSILGVLAQVLQGGQGDQNGASQNGPWSEQPPVGAANPSPTAPPPGPPATPQAPASPAPSAPQTASAGADPSSSSPDLNTLLNLPSRQVDPILPAIGRVPTFADKHPIWNTLLTGNAPDSFQKNHPALSGFVQ